MGRLNNQEFLGQFGDLLKHNEGKSSVYLTQKRLSSALELEESNTINDLSANVIAAKEYGTTQEFPILIRIAMNNKNSKKTKISTVIESNQLDQFWLEYAQVIKAGFIGLKKKDKKKSKKSKVSK